MAMIFCGECGKSISDKAKKCPHCGAPSKAASSLFSLPKVLLYILIIGAAWFVVMAIQIESKPTAESKGTRACNSEEAKEKAIQMSEKTLLGKLGAKIITFRSVDAPLKDGEKLICKAVAVMSTGGDADYIIKTELINGKQMMTIAPDDGSYDGLPKADIPQETVQPPPVTPVAAEPPPPIEQPAPPSEPVSTLREEPTDKPGWCYKAETTNEKLICDTPSLYALASRLESHWTGYRLTRTPDEVANMKGMLREWNSEVLQKCDGVDAIETAYNTLLNGIPASTESRYSIANGEPYKSVREKLITAGWKPYISPDAEPCTGSTEACEGRYPETESCAGTGLGQCRFAWERAGRLVSISTISDDHAFEGMDERKLPEKKAAAKPALPSPASAEKPAVNGLLSASSTCTDQAVIDEALRVGNANIKPERANGLQITRMEKPEPIPDMVQEGVKYCRMTVVFNNGMTDWALVGIATPKNGKTQIVVLPNDGGY